MFLIFLSKSSEPFSVITHKKLMSGQLINKFKNNSPPLNLWMFIIETYFCSCFSLIKYLSTDDDGNIISGMSILIILLKHSRVKKEAVYKKQCFSFN